MLCWFRLSLVLALFLFLVAAHLDAALERGAIFHADANSGDVSADRAFAANVDPIATLDVARYLAHDYDFAGSNAGIDFAVAPNGDAALGHGDFAFDAAVDVQRFRAADLTFNYQRTADGGLLDWRGDGFDWIVRVGVGSR